MNTKGIIGLVINIIAVALLFVFGLKKEQPVISSMNTTHQITMSTSAGDIVIDMYGEATPKTVENFVTLASEGFYDGTRFHRIIENFMVQGGDPLSKDLESKNMWGTGGPGYQFEDEFVSELSNVAGTISMANSGPGTNGSQFFLNVADNTFLDGKHTVFGVVSEGYDIVEALSQVATDGGDKPLEDVILNSVTVEAK